MLRAKLNFRLHRAVIVLICFLLLVVLMQGAAWLSQNDQQQCHLQPEDLARTLAQQVARNLAPMMAGDTPDDKSISQLLQQLTQHSRILDASVYSERGDLIARAGEDIHVRDRLALNGKKDDGNVNRQLVEPVQDKNSLRGYLRLTLDSHTLASEAQQINTTTHILCLMLLLSLAIGVVLTCTLLQEKN